MNNCDSTKLITMKQLQQQQAIVILICEGFLIMNTDEHLQNPIVLP